jgi:two-component system LytT family response regulator
MSTTSIKAIIIDDEQAALDTLKIKLDMYCPQVDVVGVCNSAKQGLQSINKYKPKLVFLDIEMPWMNGFEMLNCLGDSLDFDVVFVTAYDQYAIRAFKVKAQDYLLKPVDKDDLINCVYRITESYSPFNQEKLTDLLGEMDKPLKVKRILLHTKNAIEIVNQVDINYLEADSNYCSVYTIDGNRIMVTKPLNALENILDKETFIRIHRSFTVNINSIQKIASVDGSFDVVLKDGSSLPVSRRRKDELLDILGSMENV